MNVSEILVARLAVSKTFQWYRQHGKVEGDRVRSARTTVRICRTMHIYYYYYYYKYILHRNYMLNAGRLEGAQKTIGVIYRKSPSG